MDMADPGLGQPGKALSRMVAELAATQQEQAVVSRRRREEKQDQTERHIEKLAAGIRSWPTPPPPPPAFLNGVGVEEVRTVPDI